MLTKNLLSMYPLRIKLSIRDLPAHLPTSLNLLWLLWWAWIELNYRPRAYQARALTN